MAEVNYAEAIGINKKLLMFSIVFVLFFVSLSNPVFAVGSVKPDADLLNTPSQVGPAETFDVKVRLENDGWWKTGYCGGFALLTDNARITSTTLGGFSSKASPSSTWAEWYKGKIYGWLTHTSAKAYATVKAPNYKDAHSFTLKHRGWMRQSSCSGTILRDPTSGTPCGNYQCYSQSVTVVPQNPQITISGVPSEVEPEEIFTVTIELSEYGWAGYDGGGVHLRVDNGYIQDTYDKKDFNSVTTGSNYIEFYVGGSGVTLPKNSLKKATVPIKAGTSGTLKIRYRAWTRDVANYLYRDPDDSLYPDGDTDNAFARGILQWSVETWNVPIKQSACTKNDFAKSDTQVDVTSTMSSCGYSNKYLLDILQSQPVSATLYGSSQPPPRSTCSKIVPGWQQGEELQRLKCTNDNKWYWVEYPASLNGVPTATIETAGDDQNICPLDSECSFKGSGSDPDNDPITFKWTFGDGKTATGESVSHTFTSLGSFSVTLEVSDNKGAKEFDHAVITVKEIPLPDLTISEEDIEIR